MAPAPSDLVPPPSPEARTRTAPLQELDDEALDAYVLTRLALLGVDLSVLPEDDEEAPVDRRRVLASARRFLRSTPGALADFEMDVQDVPPLLYPGTWSGRTGVAP